MPNLVSSILPPLDYFEAYPTLLFRSDRRGSPGHLIPGETKNVTDLCLNKTELRGADVLQL